MDPVHHRTGPAEAVARSVAAKATSPNAYDPCDTPLGFIDGSLCGADKMPRIAHLAHDSAAATVLGIETVPSQSTLSLFARCGRAACEELFTMQHWASVELEARGQHCIMTAALRAPVRTLCRHDDAAWTVTAVPGIDVQEVHHDDARLIVWRQRIAEQLHVGGK